MATGPKKAKEKNEVDAKKNLIRVYAVLVVIVALYCVLAIAMPFYHGAAFWLSFVFTIIALLAQFYVLWSAFTRGDGVRSRFLGMSVPRAGLLYLIAQLIAGFVCMAMGPLLPVWVVIVMFLLILAAAVLIVVNVEEPPGQPEEEAEEADVTAMRTMEERVFILAAQCGDRVLRKVLVSLGEQFRASDPVSRADSAAAEDALGELVDQLQDAVMGQDPDSALALVTRIEAGLAARNSLCEQQNRDE